MGGETGACLGIGDGVGMVVEASGDCLGWGGGAAVLLGLLLICCSSSVNLVSMLFRLAAFLEICARIWQGQSDDQEVSEEGPEFVE